MKRFTAGFVAGLVLAGSVAAAAPVTFAGFPTARVLVNGTEQAFDTPAVNIEGRVMVPVRFIAEVLGAQVTWDGGQNAVMVTTNQAAAPAPAAGQAPPQAPPQAPAMPPGIQPVPQPDPNRSAPSAKLGVVIGRVENPSVETRQTAVNGRFTVASVEVHKTAEASRVLVFNMLWENTGASDVLIGSMYVDPTYSSLFYSQGLSSPRVEFPVLLKAGASERVVIVFGPVDMNSLRTAYYHGDGKWRITGGSAFDLTVNTPGLVK